LVEAFVANSIAKVFGFGGEVEDDEEHQNRPDLLTIESIDFEAENRLDYYSAPSQLASNRLAPVRAPIDSIDSLQTRYTRQELYTQSWHGGVCQTSASTL